MLCDPDDKQDRLARTVQTKLETNPLILTGSGASVLYNLPSI